MKKTLTIILTAIMAAALIPAHVSAQERTGIGGASAEASLLPTRARVFDFLALDRTDEHAYVHGTYECDAFSMDLVKAARGAGLTAHEAQVDWSTGPYPAHVFVAFETREGPLWIEPQDDAEYSTTMENGLLCKAGGQCWTGTVIDIWYWNTNGKTVYDPARHVWGP